MALLPPAALAVGGGYLPFLDPLNVDEFWTALDLRTALNKLTVIGAACARTEEALRERYEEEGRLVLEQYTVDRGAEEAYQRLVEELLEAEERELDRARAACVTQQREYLVEVVKQGLERIEFLVGIDPAAAIAFLRRADKYWESIRLGLEECQQLYAQISDGTYPEVVSEEKMCRAEEVELLLGALQRFVDQASEMVKKAEDTPLGNLPVIPLDSDHVDDAGRDGDPLLDLEEVAEGPVDLEKYLPGILPVVPGRPDSGLVKTSAPLTGEVIPTAETTAEGPTEMTEDPTIIIGGPSGVTEGPTEMREDPTILIGGPGEVTGGPTEMKEDSTVFTRGPSEVTGGPTEMTEDSTVFTRGPSEVTGGPTEMTEDDHSDNGSTKVPGGGKDVPESPGPASNDGEPVLHNTRVILHNTRVMFVSRAVFGHACPPLLNGVLASICCLLSFSFRHPQ